MLIILKKLLPKKDSISSNWLLKWMGPTLLHPQLWHLSRRGVALGVGLGIFFGFLIPLAQIPVAALSATLLRANVPTAIASTLVTNPVTFAPIYVIAYKLGNKLLGQKLDPKSLEQVAKGVTPQENTPETESSDNNSSIQKILNVSKPLALGLAIFAVVGSLTTYALILWFWWVWVKLKRYKRKSRHQS
tara:strand:- start:743 stop:1309 length:567 start_codon:yes stop_codon:yes gene_type:complete